MRAKRVFIPFLKYAFLITIALYILASCTVLQWRASDQEILEKFQEKNISTRISYFELDSLHLNIRVQHVEKDANAVTLLFFHGSPSSLSAWDGYLTNTALGSKANLIAVDRPGYGYSNFGKEMTSISLQAQVMDQLIDAYGLKNIIVVGSSYGGPLAARLGLLNDNIKAVVMISPALDPRQEKKIWASRFTQWKLTRWLVPTSYRVAGDEKTVHAQELALLVDDWKNLIIPVVHIHGDVDDIVPYGNIDFSKKHFTNLKVVTTPDTGHEIAWARPELIVPHLNKIIDSLRVSVK